MPTIWDAGARAALVERVRRLDPANTARWGKFSCPQMVTHLTDTIRMTLGELPVVAKGPSLLRRTPVKQLVIYALPFPKGAPTAPELLERRCAGIDGEKRDLEAAIARLAARAGKREWPEHPAFGRLSPRAVGVLVYRHIDHHLRQFGA
jgi:hypothetical protein